MKRGTSPLLAPSNNLVANPITAAGISDPEVADGDGDGITGSDGAGFEGRAEDEGGEDMANEMEWMCGLN